MGLAQAMMLDPVATHFYSGDTLHKSKAKTYELRAGDEVGDISITIPENEFHQVRGALTTVGGKGINQAKLQLKDGADEDLTFAGSLAQDGTFVFPTVPPGTYTLSVTNATFGDLNAVLQPVTVPGKPPEPPQPIPPMRYVDGSVAVIVKDADLADVNVTLKEAAMQESTVNPQ